MSKFVQGKSRVDGTPVEIDVSTSEANRLWLVMSSTNRWSGWYVVPGAMLPIDATKRVAERHKDQGRRLPDVWRVCAMRPTAVMDVSNPDDEVEVLSAAFDLGAYLEVRI